MTLEAGSEIAAGSLLNMNSDSKSVGTQIKDVRLSRLCDIDVLSLEGAQQGIGLADEAIKDLDKIRSGLGSFQNQAMSCVAGISVARVNIYSSASIIRDIDFSEEIQNLKRLQILFEAGRFALSSFSSRSSNLISLLKQIDQNKA
jgi:flagellin-like hook-associated protein FlgL